MNLQGKLCKHVISLGQRLASIYYYMEINCELIYISNISIYQILQGLVQLWDNWLCGHMFLLLGRTNFFGIFFTLLPNKYIMTKSSLSSRLCYIPVYICFPVLYIEIFNMFVCAGNKVVYTSWAKAAKNLLIYLK